MLNEVHLATNGTTPYDMLTLKENFKCKSSYDRGNECFICIREERNDSNQLLTVVVDNVLQGKAETGTMKYIYR